MFQLMFDPVGLLIEVADELFPSYSAKIFWSNELKDKHGRLVEGLTIREPGQDPTIVISLDIPFHGVVETLAHEMAHVIVGDAMHEHSAVWYETFQTLNRVYVQRVQQAAGGLGHIEVVNVGDDLAKEKGFRGLDEVNEMMAQLKIQTPGMLEAVQKWQQEDGSKAGLQALIEQSSGFEALLQEKGFADEKEWSSMVAAVDLTQPGMQLLFRNWQQNDGSKAGLQELLDTNVENET